MLKKLFAVLMLVFVLSSVAFGGETADSGYIVADTFRGMYEMESRLNDKIQTLKSDFADGVNALKLQAVELDGRIGTVKIMVLCTLVFVGFFAGFFVLLCILLAVVSTKLKDKDEDDEDDDKLTDAQLEQLRDVIRTEIAAALEKKNEN